MTVTKDEVWKAVNKDPIFLAQPEPVRNATRPFIEALPEILEGSLDEVVTLSNLMGAKIKFLRYLVENDYIKIVVKAIPEDSLGLFDRKSLAGMFQDMFAQLIEMMEPLSKDALAFFKSHGVTEEQVMLGPNVGFSSKTLKLYKAKTLTLGQVLTLQPMLIVDNTKK